MAKVVVEISDSVLENMRTFQESTSDVKLSKQNSVIKLSEIGNDAVTLLRDYGLKNIQELRSLLQRMS